MLNTQCLVRSVQETIEPTAVIANVVPMICAAIRDAQ